MLGSCRKCFKKAALNKYEKIYMATEFDIDGFIDYKLNQISEAVVKN